MIDVAVGILSNGDGCVLVQQRQENLIAAGFWEFVGGKVEDRETSEQALLREIREELGIVIRQAVPWITRCHTYDHGEVRIKFYRVSDWHGCAKGQEGQRIEWRTLDNPPKPFLAGSKKIWKWLCLPNRCIISAAEIIGVDQSILQLETLLQKPVMLQLRDKQLPDNERRRLFQAIQSISKHPRAIVLVNDHDEWAKKSDGIHLSSRKLWMHDKRPDYQWVGASCHTQEDLQQAAKIDVDFAVLSPVCKTLTHVNVPPMGWEMFSRMIENVGIPVYALGGLTIDDLPKAQLLGAQGVAYMRQGWS